MSARKAFDSGFTLIELLVVIAIIAVLATVGMVMYSSVQKTTRISKRLQDLEALKTSIETYKAATGRYPIAAGTGLCVGSSAAGGMSAATPAFFGTYMQTVPRDPLQGTDLAAAPCYRYRSDANGNEFKVWTDNSEMTDAEYRAQPNYLDPERDTGTADDCVIGTGAATAWAVFVSNGTGATNACAF